MSSIPCGCPRLELCAACLDRALYWHSGTAAARGHGWADRVARARPDLLAKPWPTTERSLELARGKVDDLSEDPRALEQLTAAVLKSAVLRWEELRVRRSPA